MCTINLSNVLQDRTLPIAGEAFYGIIVAHLTDCDKIIVDMTNVIALPSIFLNVSIGKFIANYGFDTLKQKISFINISKVQAQRLQDYLTKAIQ